MEELKCTIFAKIKDFGKKKGVEYSTRLTRTDGTQEYFRVKFNPIDIAPDVSKCPVNISFVKGIDGNKSNKPERFMTKDGIDVEIPVLWINRYDVGEPWVDHSLDEYV